MVRVLLLAQALRKCGETVLALRVAEWGMLTRQAFVHNNRPAEWTALIHAMIQKHSRKYKLRPLLEKLR